MLLLSILFIGLNACSSSDEEEETTTGGATAITLTPSTATQMVGEDITFVVKTDTGEDVTMSTALVAGTSPISNATYTTQTAGDVVIKATYQGLTATTTVKFTDVPTTSITLTANVTTQAAGDNIIFTVKTNTGINVTSSAVITTGTTTIEGGILNSPTAGSFDVSATYQDFASEVVTVTFTPSISFTKRVLIEDYTGTWCGYCPRVSQGIELVKAATDKVVVAAIHRGNDPYNFEAGVLENLIGLEGYPTAMLNRKTDWTYPEPNNVQQVVNLTGGIKPKVGLAINSTVSGGNINLEVKTKFGTNMTNAKLVVYILENGLIYNQVNYTSYFGGGSVIPNFVHEHVLRASLTNLLGDAFTSAEAVYENEVTRTFNIPVPANVANASNIEFVAFVVGSDNKALNVRKANPGENQTFEIE
ncbi:Omp28-related outer membrane protein [Flavobacterium sp. PLA-1-15]|uniref:Omp28-related outer membrane protein n=1 Tax=Flavobacterium sp. PLA-1-15 TaxID=3380533 RepID=UPI003B7F900A